MKRILSFMLVLSMLFSMVAFAAPVAVNVESATEVSESVELSSEETAETYAEGDKYVTVIDFEDATASDTAFVHSASNNGKAIWFSAFDYATYRQNITNTNTAALPQMHFGWVDGFYQQETVGETTNNYLRFEGFDNGEGSGYRYHRFRISTDTFTTPGTYTISFKARRPAGTTWSNLVYGYDATGSYAQNLTAANVPATWTDYSFDVEVDETTTLRYISFQWTQSKVDSSDSGSAYVGDTAAIEFDDIKYYYTAPAAAEVPSVVTFDANGVTATVPTAVEGTVGTAIDLTGYTATTEDTTKTFKGWATTATGEVVTTFTPSEATHTLYAIWETVEVEEPETTYPTSGVIFFEDFEDGTVGATEFYLAEAGVLEGFVADAYKDYRPKASNSATDWYKPGVASTQYTLVQESGNKFMKKTEGLAWQYFGVSFADAGWGIITPGTYTLTYDVICDGRAISNAAYNNNSHPYMASGAPDYITYTTTANDMTPNGRTVSVSWTIGVDDNAESVTKHAARLVEQFTASNASTTYLGVDNIKLEYVAPVVVTPSTVTFDANGVTATVPDAVEGVVGEEIDLAVYTATTTDTTKTFKGWATTANGEVVTTFTPSEATHTLYAIWETVEVEEPESQYPTSGVIFFEDFEDGTVGATEFYLAQAGVLEGFVADEYKDYRPKASNVATDWFKPGVASTQYTLVQESGNKFMKKTDGLGWQYFGVSFADPGWGIITPGTYTLTYDVICDGRAISNAAYNKNSFPYMAEGSPDYITYTTTANDMTPNGMTVKVEWKIGVDDNAESVTKHAARLVEQFNASNASTTYLGVDNIKLEYQAPITVVPATVTFNANGVTATVPDAIETTTGTEIDLSTYKATTTDASKIFAGWATSANGTVITTYVPTEATSTLYAIWTDAVTDGYVVDMDFEGSTVGDVLLTAPGSTVAWKGAHNKALAKYRQVIGSTSAQNGFSGSWLGGDATVAQLADGNKVMQVVNSASNNAGWNRLAIRTPDFSLEGKYTVSFKYMVPTGSAVDRILIYNSDYTTNFSGNTVSKFVGTDIKNDVWYTYSVTLDVSSTNKLSAVKFQPKSTADGGIFYLDDIKYYYESPKAPSVVTFATTNGAVEVPAAANAGIGGILDLSLYIPKINDSTLKFKGWSTTTDATGLIEGVFTPTEAAHTLYAITEQAALVHPYFSTDFNEGDKVIFADGKAEVGGVVQYYKTHTVVDGVLRTTFTDADTDETTGKGTWIPDPIQTHKYVTADTPLVKDDIKGIAVAYKFNDTVYNGDWTGNTLGLNKDYNKADVFLGAVNAADSQLKNVGNVWQYNNRNAMVYYDFANAANWTANWANVAAEIGVVRFDLLQGAYDGLTYDLDYVKFVLADDRILPTIPAETQMALDGDYAVTFTYPQGLNVTEDDIAPDAFGKYAINFEFVGENQIKVYVNPAYAWAGNVVPVKSPGFKNADGTKTYVTTYYNMTFESLGVPTTLDVAQIRIDADDTTKQGMRYAAYIESAVEACEYGYIVTLESSLDDGMGGFAYDMFTMDENISYNGTAISGTNASGVKLVGAVAITGTGAQTIYSTTGEEFGDYAIDDGLYFTTVLTGIPLTQTGVTTRFVGRPYVKLTDGTYVHGAPITRALIDIANEVIENTEGGMVNCDMYIKNIYMASMGMFG